METRAYIKSCSIYTPPTLSRAIVCYLSAPKESTWLEPCAGAGSFLVALAERGIQKRRIVAIDLSRKAEPADGNATTKRGVDFLGWSLTTGARFDRIVANPPFVGLSKVPPVLRATALRIQDIEGHSVSLGANCWYAFLCAAMNLLKPNGSLAFVLPAAWDYADYASKMRNSIHERFAHVEVHRTIRPIFQEVLEGSVVLIAKGLGGSSESLHRYEHASREELEAHLMRREGERSRTVLGDRKSKTCESGELIPLGKALRIGIGGVTGDARFFLLTEAQRIARGLPISCLVPVVTKSSHLVTDHITEVVWRGLLAAGRRVWLFRPATEQLRIGPVKEYLELPSDEGGCHRTRYKIKNREPWFQTVLPQHVDGFVSGMSGPGPWICFNEMPRLSATNTLYVVQFPPAMGRNEKHAWALSMLTSVARTEMAKRCRVYAGGLAKYEPGDLASALIPRPPKRANAKTAYSRAVKALLKGDWAEAESVADGWVFSPSPDPFSAAR